MASKKPTDSEKSKRPTKPATDNIAKKMETDEFWDALMTGETPRATQPNIPIERSSIVDRAMIRPINNAELYYLLGKYPYLILCDPNSPIRDPEQKTKIVAAASGWVIHDYDNIIASSYCEGFDPLRPAAIWTSFEQLLQEEDERGGTSGRGSKNGGHGTIVQQFFDTAFEMMTIAKNRWSAAQILGGFYSMRRAAWIASEMTGLTLEGFEPTAEDHVVKTWANRHSKDRIQKTLDKISKPKMRQK